MSEASQPSGNRSILRVRDRDHIHPGRRGETVIEVVREGEVVAHIYGSREGLHIVTERQPHNRVFAIEGKLTPTPGWSLTLLKKGEPCPWCAGEGHLRLGEHEIIMCPVCSPLTEPR